jgi:8-oxo-dGTP diphosphatase
MIRSTLGFIFNTDLSKVLLIHKLSPEWQKGKVNGLGGKCEENETCYQCITREVQEETGLFIPSSQWKKVAEIHSSTWYVDVMTCIYSGKETDAKSMEKQTIEWFPLSQLPSNIMSNLSWLIPLCKDALQVKELESAIIKYNL